MLPWAINDEALHPARQGEGFRVYRGKSIGQ